MTSIKKMQFSGYSQQFRTKITTSALNAYKEIKRKDITGEEPMYRKKTWNKEQRDKKKREKKNGNWYTNKGAESVIFIPATPNSILKNRIEKKIKANNNFKIKIIEKGGQTIKSMLNRQKQKPQDETKQCKCLICKSGGKPGQCRQEGTVYQIKCNICNDTYVGESGINAFTRINQHLEDENNPKLHKHSVLHRHQQEKHNNNKVTYTAQVLATYPTSSLRRQIAESIQINKIPPGTKINNAEEWHTYAITSLRATQFTEGCQRPSV